MHVTEAPVSIKAGNVVICPENEGVKTPAGMTPILMSDPMLGSNLPLRHGMREKPQVHRCFNYFLDGEKVVLLEDPLTDNIGISGSVKKVDDLTIPHQREFSSICC